MISYRWIRRIVMIVLSVLMVLVLMIIIKEKIYRYHSHLPKRIMTVHPMSPISVISYNIQGLPWLLKQINPLKKIVKDASFICLQECFVQFKDYDIQHHFPNYYICRGKMKRLSFLNSGLAIISKYPILEHHFVPYKHFNMYSYDSFSEKGFLTALIKIGDQQIRLITTHLQSSTYEEYDPVALLQYQEMMDYIKTIKIPYLITGDFNIDIDTIKSHFPYQTYHYSDDPTIYINFKHGKTQTVPEKGFEGRRLDYFLSNKIECTKPKVITTEFSDHLPVETFISFETQTSQ